MDALSVHRCFCPCHLGSVLQWRPPPVTDPVESLAACELCQPLHKGVWKIWRGPGWVDSE